MLPCVVKVHWHSLWLLYICYGVIGGIGLGVGYITPVSTLVKYFPKHRGFATGLAIMGFGFASLIAGPLMVRLIGSVGLLMTFVVLALIYGVVMVASALYLAPPKAPLNELKDVVVTQTLKTFTANQAMKTWKFYALWWIFFINISCGIGLLALASPMAQEVVGMSVKDAATMVGIIGLINGLGRILWSSASDFLGRANTYVIFFVIEVMAFYGLSGTTSSFLFQFLVFVIVSCYGGGFACMPAYISDLFGMKSLAAIHGRILTAWGMAGIAGPLLISFLRETTQSYTLCLWIFAGMFVLNVVVALVLKFGAKTIQTPVTIVAAEPALKA